MCSKSHCVLVSYNNNVTRHFMVVCEKLYSTMRRRFVVITDFSQEALIQGVVARSQ